MTVAVVTGANSGIGRQVAVDLAAKGWTVFGTMRSPDKGAKLAAMAADAGVAVEVAVCDVTDTESVNTAMVDILARAGRIDVLVNNAGIGGNGVLEEVPVEVYQQVMDVTTWRTGECSPSMPPGMPRQATPPRWPT